MAGHAPEPRQRIAIVVALVAVIAAVWVVSRVRDETLAVSSAAPDEAAAVLARADLQSKRADEDGASRDSATTADVAAEASVDAGPACAEFVRVVDSGGRPVPGPRIHAFDEERTTLCYGVVDAGGYFALPAGWVRRWRGVRIVVSMACRRVEVPAPLGPERVFSVGFGDVGSLLLVSEGDDCDVAVFAKVEGGGVTNVTNVQTVDGRCEVRVPAGVDLVYRVVAGVEQRRVTLDPVGAPRGQGDVVELKLDLAACRVTGRFTTAAANCRATFATVLGPDGASTHPVHLDRDEVSFFVDLPRGPATSIWFTSEGECAPCPPIALDVDARDVAEVVWEPRRHLGRTEVRDPEGNVRLDCSSVLSFATSSGQRVPTPSGATQLVEQRQRLNSGIDWFAVPVVTEVVVETAGRWEESLVATPDRAVVREGRAVRVDLVPGATVVASSHTRGFPNLQLRSLATQQVRFGDQEHLGDGVWQFVFRGVAPGRYEVEAAGASVLGGSVVVRDAAEYEVSVTVRPR